MANPRKFSEKIALHIQKQAEGTAAFEAILKEVSATTKSAATQQTKQSECPAQHAAIQRLVQPTTHVYRGCSLPNVNQESINKSPINLRNALSSLEDIKSQADGRSPSGSRHSINDKSQGRNGISERSSSHPRKHTSLTRHRDISPYGSVYLSPPADASWRRVSSDSAIHSSVFAEPNQNSKLLINCEQVYSNDNITLCFGSPDVNGEGGNQLWANQNNANRPKSCDVPGISIYPSPELLNSVRFQLAGSSNPSGSLPNLNTSPHHNHQNNVNPELIVGSLPPKLITDNSYASSVFVGSTVGKQLMAPAQTSFLLSQNNIVIVNDAVPSDIDNSSLSSQSQMSYTTIMPNNLSFPHSVYVQTYNQNNCSPTHSNTLISNHNHTSPNNNSGVDYVERVQLTPTMIQMILNQQNLASNQQLAQSIYNNQQALNMQNLQDLIDTNQTNENINAKELLEHHRQLIKQNNQLASLPAVMATLR